MEERDTADGHEISEDGKTWMLVTPSPEWLARRAASPDPVIEPEPASAEITLADVAAALRDPLADLTPSSASTTVRTAILAQRAALDALLAQLDGGTP